MLRMLYNVFHASTLLTALKQYLFDKNCKSRMFDISSAKFLFADKHFGVTEFKIEQRSDNFDRHFLAINLFNKL